MRDVVFPVAGGAQTLREVVAEFRANGPEFRRNVQVWGSPRTVDIEGGLPGGLAERMFTWRLQEDHSRRSTGLRPLIG